jgi:MOSC domain-containing protein YiiM
MSAPNAVTIAAIGIKEAKGLPLTLVESASISVEGGLEGHTPTREHRQVTFISEEQWADTLAELDVDLPWHTRRANILVCGTALESWLGKSLKIGEVEVTINGETEPCSMMDQIHQGLRGALTPECRGGVYGSVNQGGILSVGDTIVVSD